MEESRQLLNSEEIQDRLTRMARHITALAVDPGDLALIGIRTHGVTIAKRIREMLQPKTDAHIPLGILDITLYRDDLGRLGGSPVVKPTLIDFDLTGRTVVLIDDVLYTGRTIRCALAEIMDFGRPRAIRLAVLVDRGLRELPIQADIIGLAVETTDEQKIDVRFKEGGDGQDGVWLFRPGRASES